MTLQNPPRGDGRDLSRRLAAMERRLHALETAPRIGPLFATRTSDSAAVVSSTTLHDEDQLVLVPRAGVTYTLDGLLLWTGDVTGDIKFAFGFPSSSTLHWAVPGGPNEAGLTSPPPDVTRGTGQWWAQQAQTSSPTGTIQYAASTAVMSGRLSGLLVTGSAAAGALTLKWAQNTSSATGLVLKAGSWIRLTPERI